MVVTHKQVQSLSDLLHDAVEEGSKLFNDGKKRDCFELFLETAKYACAQTSVKQSVIGLHLELAVDEAARLEKQQEWNGGVWLLRRAFDKVRKEPEAKNLEIVDPEREMEPLSNLLRRTIDEGAPLYNNGFKKECFQLYLETTKFASEQDSLFNTTVGQLFRLAIYDSQKFEQKQQWKDGAWRLRDLFDAVLAHDEGATAENLLVRTQRSVVASIAKVLDVKDRRYHFKVYPDCFVGSEAVTMLVDANLADSRQDATAKLEQLLQANLIHHVEREHSFRDEYLFYRFTTQDVEPSVIVSEPAADEELVSISA